MGLLSQKASLFCTRKHVFLVDEISHYCVLLAGGDILLRVSGFLLACF